MPMLFLAVWVREVTLSFCSEIESRSVFLLREQNLDIHFVVLSLSLSFYLFEYKWFAVDKKITACLSVLQHLLRKG